MAKFARLTIVAWTVLATGLFIMAFSCSSSEVTPRPHGTSNSGGSGGTPGVGGGVATGGGFTTGGAPTTGGAANTGGVAPTGGTDTGGSPTGGIGGTGGSNFECTLPALPDPASLTYQNQKLPDPFTFFDGTKVTTKEQWDCRRREILAMADKYIYGPVPRVPDQVSGTVSGGTVSISATVGSATETFSASISGSGDVIALKLSGGIFPQSSKTLTFGSGFEAKIRTLFGLSELNPNVANGWMIDRVMDVLEQNPGSGHDPTKVMVSGCSGCGKGAFLAGVFSRAPLVIIVESGGGGAANLRQAEWFRHGAGNDIWQCADALPQSIDNLEDNGICGPWVTGAASWLRSNPAKVYNLPIDQHLLLATIAPRHLLHFSNNNGVNSWCHLGGTCEALSAWAAEPVWNALGVPERMGFHMYSAGHCSAPAEAISLAGEFFKRAFEGDASANTDVMDIMANGVQQPVSEWQSMWVDWDMETTLQ
jgi:(4-O-methyl)-D-glucuronate---lignin esterase